jgi:hypothetical protein
MRASPLLPPEALGQTALAQDVRGEDARAAPAQTRLSRHRVVRLLGIGVLSALVTLGLMILIPNNPYIRWQDMRVEAYARLGWIYERIHDDPTPIDVAFLGTSHTMNGVNASVVAAGMSKAEGRCVHAVNFAIPQYGRNMQWVIARELLENRKVGRLVLEVFEDETRKPHPLFIYPARAADVLGAPALINLDYFSDIALLPMRQVRLGLESLWPAEFGLHAHFDPKDYDGEDVDNTRIVHVHGRVFTRLRSGHEDPAELDRQVRQIDAGRNLHMLPKRFAALEYHYPLYYLDRILDLARQKGVPVTFLYLPAYGQPAQPYDMHPFVGRGPMLFVNDILRDKSNWLDYAHLNMFGAATLSDRLGQLLSAGATPDAAAPAVCGPAS